ncbi:tetraacyldisaccharide 4'-kinase [uncultured Desulfuromusa sp.]|uniref:tetraacyldisaccharide 4'-kinase n=1 Tax=uncultured Desulfuromusa sp. TaxID=219183 RepID=UPI002AA724C4|nr:tetraacyldisaccharide 4'-kinase [uncultured Desulfuromusa sp.]
MSCLLAIHRSLVKQGARNLWEKLLLLLLLPFSILYGGVGWIRNRCYDSNVFPAYQAHLPVISVGNLAAGGTGKTPVVDWLVKEFGNQRKRAAIVSRGYAGSFNGDVGIVSRGDGILMSPAECGDEPYLLAKRNPRCSVIIAKKRIHAMKVLEQHEESDVIILDDGFQHRAVKRDVDLVLLDASRPLGNGWPLPAGNLREFPDALKRADFILMSRSKLPTSDDFMGYKVYNSEHQLADIAVDLDGDRVPVDQLKGLKLLAFAGIADPESFFSSLEKIGLSLTKRLSFTDHTEYRTQILEQLNKAAMSVDALITTEKDAVKLAADMFTLPCYQIPMDINIDNSTELMERLKKRLWS